MTLCNKVWMEEVFRDCWGIGIELLFLKFCLQHTMLFTTSVVPFSFLCLLKRIGIPPRDLFAPRSRTHSYAAAAASTILLKRCRKSSISSYLCSALSWVRALKRDQSALAAMCTWTEPNMEFGIYLTT